MFLTLLREVSKGKSMLRAYTNYAVSGIEVKGKTADIGGGKDPSYLRFLNTTHATITSIDFKVEENKTIDLEKDSLPFASDSVDSVLMFNILEHIYNHLFLAQEARRILKPGGGVLGFVPFLIQYHPDPHDYFRYTKEALGKIFKEAGFKVETIEEVGAGPFSVNFNNLMFAFPIFARVMLFPLYYVADLLALKWKPRLKERYPSGFKFEL